MKIDYSIKGLEPEKYEGEGKYIVVGRLESGVSHLSLYASHFANGHLDVVCTFNLQEEDILGGGRICIGTNRVSLYDFSDRYGAVPGEVAEKFGALLSNGKRRVFVDRLEKTGEPHPIRRPYFNWEDWKKYGIEGPQS